GQCRGLTITARQPDEGIDFEPHPAQQARPRFSSRSRQSSFSAVEVAARYMADQTKVTPRFSQNSRMASAPNPERSPSHTRCGPYAVLNRNHQREGAAPGEK